MGRMADDWRRLGVLAKERRDELGLTQVQVQERGGPSSALVRALETGRTTSMTRSKRRDLERALNWRTGSVDDILAGGRPEPEDAEVDIPHVRQHPGGKFELSMLATEVDPVKMIGLAVMANVLSEAADDFENDKNNPKRLITLAHKTYHSAMELLADAMGVDTDDARKVAQRFSYVLGDNPFGIDDSPRK